MDILGANMEHLAEEYQIVLHCSINPVTPIQIASTAVNAAALQLLVTTGRLVKELIDAAAVW